MLSRQSWPYTSPASTWPVKILWKIYIISIHAFKFDALITMIKGSPYYWLTIKMAWSASLHLQWVLSCPWKLDDNVMYYTIFRTGSVPACPVPSDGRCVSWAGIRTFLTLFNSTRMAYIYINNQQLQSIDDYSSNVVYCWPSLNYIVELPKVSELLFNAEIVFQYNWYCNLFSLCLRLGTHTTIIVLYFICVVSVSINTISTPVAKGQIRVCFGLPYHLKNSATVSNWETCRPHYNETCLRIW